MAKRNFRRLGVRIHAKPGKDFILGLDTEIYDVDTGDLLPVENADLHLSADSIVTATMTVDIAKVDIITDAKENVDGRHAA